MKTHAPQHNPMVQRESRDLNNDGKTDWMDRRISEDLAKFQNLLKGGQSPMEIGPRMAQLASLLREMRDLGFKGDPFTTPP